MSDRLASARQLVSASTRVVALTGAGISTESGIPDFRGPNGVWTRNPKAERMSNIHDYMADPEVRKLSWQARLDHAAWRAEPNDGHRALVALERAGKLTALVTQNIDGLHQRAGSAPATVIELHGTMRDVMCMSCGWRGPTPPVLERVRQGEKDPPCVQCGGILKSATVSFGQPLVPQVIDRAMRSVQQADLLLAIGSSLQVFPAAGLVPLAKEGSARLVIVNAEPTPFDDLADVVLREPIGRVMPVICESALA